jgi:6-phospho-beta-glucosidase
MKAAVIGGGSTYTPELVSGFLERREQLPLKELCLMDIDAHRLKIVGEFAQRIVQAQGSPFEVRLSTDRGEALRGASYAITQLRVGQMAARREDEYLGKRHGLIGQETTGIGGMSKALRTIPVILEIAREMLEMAAPGAMLINFTNPAGLVTQALSDYCPETPSVGVCNAPITTKMEILELLREEHGEEIDPQRAELDTLGLNHLSWHRGLRIDGEDVWPAVMQASMTRLAGEAEPMWEPETIAALGMLPNYYLQYYYQRARMLAKQAEWPPSRAEAVLEIEAQLLKQYASPELREPPAELMQRGGAYYSTVATQLINAHFNDLGETHVVNTPNHGAVGEWPDNWVLEIPAKVSQAGIEPLAAAALTEVCFGLIAEVKAYELLTVEAAVHGDRQAAYQALLAHPLGPEADQVQSVLDDMLVTQRDYLPNFWEK